MTRLLVSVRNAQEALVAARNGAGVVDVKDPARGPLGRADPADWVTIRNTLAAAGCVGSERTVPLSAALGELVDYPDGAGPLRRHLFGYRYVKVGLSRCGGDARETWMTRLDRLRNVVATSETSAAGALQWIAVIYADWQTSAAPGPQRVRAYAHNSGCAGVLIDTWDKSLANPILTYARDWADWVAETRSLGLMTAVAGKLDTAGIAGVLAWRPDLIAVRSAACRNGVRTNPVDPGRVARLAQMLVANRAKANAYADANVTPEIPASEQGSSYVSSTASRSAGVRRAACADAISDAHNGTSCDFGRLPGLRNHHG